MTERSQMPDGMRLIEEFLNTVDERTFRRHGTAHAGGDRLASPAALSEWLAGHGLLPAGTRLRQADLAEGIRLRTALRQALLAAAPERETVAVFVDFPLHLVPGAEGALRLAATGAAGLAPIVEAVATAVVSGSWARLRICAAPDCRWVFYDVSRSGGGRWCSMAVCGNRAKTRSYRQRQRTA
ncbi:CGNR zinc finger domain-containing protein [Plantactinospora sp. WMMC1484]|uniref:CGNR zinc finger domain-containing protein n=1 Tax=Plantactinospora sp. WMMC1484 TaxID=3404122 RepID=UPI003BF46DDF